MRAILKKVALLFGNTEKKHHLCGNRDYVIHLACILRASSFLKREAYAQGFFPSGSDIRLLSTI